MIFHQTGGNLHSPGRHERQTMENVHEVPVDQLSDTAFVLRLAAGVLLVNLFIFTLSFLSLRQNRLNHEQRATVTTGNLSLLMEQNISGSIDKTDVVLVAAVEEFEHQLAGGGIDRHEMNSFLAGLAGHLPEVNCVSVADARGKIIFGARNSACLLGNVADRRYFRQLRDKPKPGLFLSGPLTSRVTGKPVIILARRISHADGSFAGVVCGVIPIEHFKNVFSSIQVGPHGAVTLRNNESEIIARLPDPGGTLSITGIKKASREVRELIGRGKQDGTFKARSAIDGIDRTYSFRRFSNYPLNIAIGLATEDYLADWWSELGKMSAALVLFFLLTIIASMGIYRYWQRRNAAVRELILTRLCINNAAIGIYVVLEDGTIRSVNDYACRSLGYSREELLSMNILEIAPAITAEKAAEITKVLDTQGHATHESIHRRKDGTIFPVEITTNIVRFGGKEYPLSFVQDITERKRAATEITRSEQKFRAIFENALDVIFLINKEFVFVDCNPAATKLFSCGKMEIIGKDMLYFSPAVQPDGIDSMEKAVGIMKDAFEGRPQSFEWRHRIADGSEFDVMVALSRFEFDGEPILVAVVRDISQRKSLENQLYHAQKMEAVGQLAGGVAHDFNNILTAMIGFVHLILMKMKEDDPSSNYVKQISILAERAAELTQGLLAFSRKQIMVPKPVDLNETVIDLRKMLKRLIRANIELKVETAPGTLVALADRGKVEQALMNLVTNARDAIAGEGTITIKTSVFAMTEQFIRGHGFGKIGRYACITVSDSGCGINGETRKKIFEPFFTTKEVGKGTGLGLSIVYGIIKQHNGYIFVCSGEGKGTTFNICLPLADNPPETACSAQGAPSLFRGNETLLLAEDDAILNDLHRELLEEAGYRVITAENGEEALEKFIDQNDLIDLLILDAVMPRLNGKKVLDSARTVKPGINALFVSGYPADILNEADMLQEDIELLMKPITPNVLLMKIRELLDSRCRNS